VARLGEGVLAQGLGQIQARYPELELGSYPFYRASGNGVAVVAKGTNPARIADAIGEVSRLIVALNGTPVPGEPPAEQG
jgi:hypothetical protein